VDGFNALAEVHVGALTTNNEVFYCTSDQICLRLELRSYPAETGVFVDDVCVQSLDFDIAADDLLPSALDALSLLHCHPDNGIYPRFISDILPGVV
jgi:hypothetical protein